MEVLPEHHIHISVVRIPVERMPAAVSSQPIDSFNLRPDHGTHNRDLSAAVGCHFGCFLLQFIVATNRMPVLRRLNRQDPLQSWIVGWRRTNGLLWRLFLCSGRGFYLAAGRDLST